VVDISKAVKGSGCAREADLPGAYLKQFASLCTPSFGRISSVESVGG